MRRLEHYIKMDETRVASRLPESEAEMAGRCRAGSEEVETKDI
jgi:hypothetical protein